jgi:hypothetical protein
MIPSLSLAGSLTGSERLDLGFIAINIGTVVWWKAALHFIPNAIVTVGLWQLIVFARALTMSNGFTSDLSDSLQVASILFVVGVLMSWIVEPLIVNVSFWDAFQQLLQNHGLLLLISFAFSLVAGLLRRAKEIEDENKEFY